MKLFTLTLSTGVPMEPAFGFQFKVTSATGEALLDDDMISVRLDRSQLKVTKREQFSVLNGFITLPGKILTQDILEDEKEAVLLHIKVRLSRTTPPCIIKTVTEEHVPVVSLKTSDWEKSLIFQVEEKLPVIVTIGRAEYSFEYKGGTLQMFNKTDPTWPSLPPPVIVRQNRKNWFSRLFERKNKADFRPTRIKPERLIRIVDVR